MTVKMKISIQDLTPHPKYVEIYGGDNSTDELEDTLKETGKVSTLIIDAGNRIICGVLRWKACQNLLVQGDKRFEKVDCNVKSFDSEDDLVLEILNSNVNRRKDEYQMNNEATLGVDILVRREGLTKEKARIKAAKLWKLGSDTAIKNRFRTIKATTTLTDSQIVSGIQDALQHGNNTKAAKILCEHNKSQQPLSVKEIIAEIKDEDRDTSSSPLQIALACQANTKNFCSNIMDFMKELPYDSPIDPESKDIYKAIISQLTEVIEVFNDKLH